MMDSASSNVTSEKETVIFLSNTFDCAAVHHTGRIVNRNMVSDFVIENV